MLQAFTVVRLENRAAPGKAEQPSESLSAPSAHYLVESEKVTVLPEAHPFLLQPFD